jgi:prepilin-type N-terminal cleavage/methylation domain-containing protein
MTSRTGPTIRRSRNAAARAWKVGARGRAGFTLVEIVLVLSLILLLTGVAALTMGGWKHSMDLEEGSQSLVTGLKMARADAANMGKRLRLVFDPDSGQGSLQWESDPLANPGVFTDYATCTWKAFLENPDVQVKRCDFTGSSTWRTLMADSTTGQSNDQPTLAPITFEPDGSSDSVRIEMVPADPAATQHAVIELEGMIGRVTSRIESITVTSTTGSP